MLEKTGWKGLGEDFCIGPLSCSGPSSVKKQNAPQLKAALLLSAMDISNRVSQF